MMIFHSYVAVYQGNDHYHEAWKKQTSSLEREDHEISLIYILLEYDEVAAGLVF